MHSCEAKGVCVDQYTVDEWKAELAKLCKGLFTIWSVLNKKSKQTSFKWVLQMRETHLNRSSDGHFLIQNFCQLLHVLCTFCILLSNHFTPIYVILQRQ